MDSISRNKHVARLLCPYHLVNVNKKDYILYQPTYDIVYRSYLVYDEEIDKTKYEGWSTDRQNLDRLCQEGICLRTIDKDIENIYTLLDDIKVQVYKNILRLDIMKKTKRKLRNQEKYLFKLLKTRHSLDYLTVEHNAEKKRSEFIISSCLYDDNKKKIKNPPIYLINNIYLKSMEQMIPHKDLRDISKNAPWNLYWNIYGKDLFDFGKKYELSEEQKALISISQIYDDAKNKAELTDKKILEDDDLFDGWKISQYRDYQKSVKEKESGLPKTKGKQNMGQEMFVPVKTQEELDYVNEMNTGSAQFTKNRRKGAIKGKGEVSESQLPDQQDNLREIAKLQRRQ